MALQLYDTFSKSKRLFEPIDASNVKMYVCGPTVYDYPHVGNARPVIVFDILFRVLQNIYGEIKYFEDAIFGIQKCKLSQDMTSILKNNNN